MGRILFEDTEFTSLVPAHRPAGSRLWEVGLIVRDSLPKQDPMEPDRYDPAADREYRWMVSDVDLSDADPKSLDVGRFHDRHPVFNPAAATALSESGKWREVLMPEQRLAARVAELFTPGCTLIGAAPQGDVDHLRDLLFRHRLPWVPHHHVIDIESWAVGWLNGRWVEAMNRGPVGSPAPFRPPLPWRYRDVLAAVGIVQDEDEEHTALGDARIVRQVWDLTTWGGG